MELLSTEQMRRLEISATDSSAATSLDLMERAGSALADAADGMGFAARGRAAVFCGPGANGGDGYVAARKLVERGWDVACFALGAPERLPPDAAEMARRWRMIGSVRPFAPEGSPRRYGLIVDALFGSGLTRPLSPDIGARWRAIAASGRVAAADCPSGLCLDTGRDLDAPSPAELTVTFHRAKRGHYLEDGPDLCGRLVIADIGLGDDAPADSVTLAAPDPELLRKGGRRHKYDHGHVLALAGGVARGGAARLAARAALRVGAGLVTIGAPGAALIENAARLEAIMLRRLDDADALEALMSDRRISAIILGPGLGVGERLGARTRALALGALRSDRAVVLDADALTAFADAPETLWAACRERRAILTPHDGEFARLFPDLGRRLSARDQGYGRIEAARDAAARAGATLLLKGRDTVIAEPSGAVVLHAAAYERAAPWLATAGSGDVLAGLIGGLMARGAAPAAAAATACWLHVEAARAVGPGLIAEDLPEALPRLLGSLLGNPTRL